MTEHKRNVAARQLGKILLSLFFLPCSLAVAGQSDQKQDTEEDETGMPAVPSGTVEDTMIILKVALCAQSHGAQSAAHGALSW